MDTKLHAQDMMPDFTLTDLQGNPVTLSDKLAEGKPVVLVTLSYTCSVAFNHAKPGKDSFHALKSAIGSTATILLIYTAEAHPQAGGDAIQSNSPYRGEPWPTNVSSIYYQPTTYAERLTYAQAFPNLVGLTVLVDDLSDSGGDSNSVWCSAFECPNCALVVAPSGRVAFSQPWFNWQDLPGNVQVLQNWIDTEIAAP